jgi:hypothetical protein
MEKLSRDLLTRAAYAASKMRYGNIPAKALVPLGRQFMVAGGNDEKVGQSIVLGVVKALDAEKKHAYPVCPFCGRRHAAPKTFLLGSKQGGSRR